MEDILVSYRLQWIDEHNFTEKVKRLEFLNIRKTLLNWSSSIKCKYPLSISIQSRWDIKVQLKISMLFSVNSSSTCHSKQIEAAKRVFQTTIENCNRHSILSRPWKHAKISIQKHFKPKVQILDIQINKG